jgi:hypothetical protein
MKLSINIGVLEFPIQVSAIEALNFFRHETAKHDVLMVVAAGWRENPEMGEEDWFEELTADEFEDEDFLDQFQTALLQLWMR